MSAKNGGRPRKSVKQERAHTIAEKKLIEEAKAKAIKDKENDDEKRAIDSYNNYIAKNAIQFNVNKHGFKGAGLVFFLHASRHQCFPRLPDACFRKKLYHRHTCNK